MSWLISVTDTSMRLKIRSFSFDSTLMLYFYFANEHALKGASKRQITIRAQGMIKLGAPSPQKLNGRHAK